MSSRTEERETFIAHLTRAYPTLPVPLIVHTARALMSAAASHGRLAVEDCNGWGEPIGERVIRSATEAPKRVYVFRTDEQMEECEVRNRLQTGAVQRRIDRQLKRFADTPASAEPPRVQFGGDPRGYTVKLTLPNGVYNTMGGAEEGYGVPGS